MCFVWISEQTAIISLYSINWLVFITETECVYCAVRTGSIYNSGLKKNLRSAHTVFLCVLCGSENKQRLFPYTTVTGWFCNRDGVCLLRGTDWVFIYNSGLNKNLRSAHTLYLRVLCGSQNKQPLFPYTTVTGRFCNRDGVCLQRGTSWVSNIIQVTLSL